MTGRIKEIEKQMKDNIELQGHIVDYAKTREIYVEYKKSGFDNGFFEEHAEEYRKLGKEKGERYYEYRKAKVERKEIGVVEENVRLMIGMGDEIVSDKNKNININRNKEATREKN